MRIVLENLCHQVQIIDFCCWTNSFILSLQRFYQSDECQNRFIETVCIADGGNGGDELKRYLEEELFLNVLVRRVNICEGVNALAQLEEENL